MSRADEWRDKGDYFSWSPRSGDASEVQVFHVELGDAGAPPLVLVMDFRRAASTGSKSQSD
jgi:hypothetical protein